jgi:hypothetical protein
MSGSKEEPLSPSPVVSKKIQAVFSEEPKSNKLDHKQIEEWNKFMDKNPKGDLETLYKQYKQLNPKSNIQFDALKTELTHLDNWLKSKATERGMVSGEYTNSGYRFPTLAYNDTNLGAVNGDIRTQTGNIETTPGKYAPIPDDVDMSTLSWDNVRGLAKYVGADGDVKFADHGEYLRVTNKKKLDGYKHQTGNAAKVMLASNK